MMRLTSLVLVFCGCTFPSDLVFGEGGAGGNGTGGDGASPTNTSAGGTPSTGGAPSGGAPMGGDSGVGGNPGCIVGDDECDMDCDQAYADGRSCPNQPSDCDDTNDAVNPFVSEHQGTEIPGETGGFDWNCNTMIEVLYPTVCTSTLCAEGGKVWQGSESGADSCGLTGTVYICGNNILGMCIAKTVFDENVVQLCM